MRSRASSLIIVSSPFTREDTYLNTTIKREMVHFWGSPSILGIAEFIVPTGSFFHAQTHVSFHIIEELSPNVRMSHFWINKTHKYAKWLLISINTFLGSGRNFGYLFWGSGTLFKCQKQSGDR